ncbi:MAG: Hsp70 family protein [Kouleothrix sp.]|nr:Hsp70 family protein [Kouleothrix sp.]
MSLIVGIDLGTTYSASAIVRDGVPQIVPHGDERIMPSVVGLTPQDTLLVGTPARNQYVLYPARTVRSIKRRMGQDDRVALGEREHTPQEISALILRELKHSVEQQLGQPVERAVITVPAYFSDAARQATREAGEIAGFTVERIINEPTAAALAYGLDRSAEQHLVAVYDLGGGTFDVSIVELDAGVVEVRASHGNTQLGGDDFDERLVEHLAERFEAEHGVNPREDRRALARLTRAAEQAKITLSSQPTARVREEYLISSGALPLHLDVEIAREEFEQLIEDLLEGTLQSFDAALSDAGIGAEQLDNILLVGGSTRIPLVQSMLHEHAGIEPVIAINPDEAVALGAAVQAAIIAGEPIEAILVDVTPHSLGIAVAELTFGQVIPDRYSVIIPRNTTIPTSRSEIYSALHPDQRAIEIQIYQGERPIASQNTLLGEFMFEDLRPETPGLPPRVAVRFDFDVDGILHVSAVDRGSGKQARTHVHAAHARLTPGEISGARDSLEELELAGWDGEALEIDAVEGEAEVAPPEMSLETIGLLTRAHRALETNPDNTALDDAIEALRIAAQRGGPEAVAARSEALLDILYELEE